jgi:Tol biopolymer transport system component
MIMKRILMLATVVLLLTLGAGTALAQSGYDLFQKALVKERAIGDVEEALRLYQRVVKEFAGDHALAAKAELRMGLLYDRLGRKADAQRAYQAVVNQYADQTNEARQARAKIVVAAPPRKINASAKTATGPNIRQVWAGADVDTEGAPSPDGRYLSFVAQGGKGNLAVRDLVTGETRTLTNDGTGHCPECAEESIWSPDGKQIVYGWLSQDNMNKFPGETVELRVIGIDGSGKRVLYRPDGPIYAWPFDWSSDGKYILAGLQKGKGKSLQIALISVADGAVRIVKTLSNWDTRLSPKMFLSPDGRYIVYNAPAQEGSSARDIFLLSVDGSREVPLVQRAADDYVLGWTPDGRGVLFASDHSGTFDAYFIPVSDGKAQGYPELVKRNVGKVDPIGLTQRGSLFYSLQADTLVRDVYIATIDPATGKLLAAPKSAIQRYIGSNYVPTWSPDGRQLAIRSSIKPVDTPGPVILSIVSIETGSEREIRPRLVSIMGGFHWTQDGQFLLVAGRDEKDHQGIYKIDPQMGDTTLSIAAPEGTWIHYPISSRDGKALFYLSSKGAVMVHNVIGGEDRTLFEARKADDPRVQPFLLTALALSSNGQWLAFKYLAKDHVSLMVIPAAGGEARELLRESSAERIHDARGIAWTPDGRYILFSKRPNSRSPYELWRIPAEGGEQQKLGLALPELSNLSLNPDGRRLAFAAGQTVTEEVWVMENFLPAAPTKKTTTSRR